MFAIKSYYTAGHAEINAFGDTNLCVSTGNASCFDELGTYQAKTGRDVIHPSKKGLLASKYGCSTRSLTDESRASIYLRFAFILPPKDVGFPAIHS